MINKEQALRRINVNDVGDDGGDPGLCRGDLDAEEVGEGRRLC